MCNICNHAPCLSGCPNAPAPEAVAHCINCNADIVEGEDYFDIDGEPWCDNCIGLAKKTAEKE